MTPAHIFLDEPELEALTGLKRPAAQIRELKRRGWVFEVTTTGRPIVSRAYAERRLGGLDSGETDAPQPRFDAIRKAAA